MSPTYSHDPEPKTRKAAAPPWKDAETDLLVKMTEQYKQRAHTGVEDDDISWGTHFDDVSEQLRQQLGGDRSSGACRSAWSRINKKRQETTSDAQETVESAPSQGSQQIDASRHLGNQGDSNPISVDQHLLPIMAPKDNQETLNSSTQHRKSGAPYLPLSQSPMHLVPKESTKTFSNPAMALSTSTGQRSKHFSKEQKEMLESEFKKNTLPTPETKSQLATRANLTLPQVNTWFKNKRNAIKSKLTQGDRADFEEILYEPSPTTKRPREHNIAQAASTSRDEGPIKRFRDTRMQAILDAPNFSVGQEEHLTNGIASAPTISQRVPSRTITEPGRVQTEQRDSQATPNRAISEPDFTLPLLNNPGLKANDVVGKPNNIIKQTSTTSNRVKSLAPRRPSYVSSQPVTTNEPSVSQQTIRKRFLPDEEVTRISATDVVTHHLHQIQEIEIQNVKLREATVILEQDIVNVQSDLSITRRKAQKIQDEFQARHDELDVQEERALGPLNQQEQGLRQSQQQHFERLESIKKNITKNDRRKRRLEGVIRHMRGEESEGSE